LRTEEKQEFTTEAAEVRRENGELFSMLRIREFGAGVHISGEGFFDLGGELEGEGVEALGQVANVLEEIVVGDEGGNGGEESGGGGDQSFGDAGSDGAEAGGACGAETGEGVDDAPDGAEEADERGDGSGGGEPGHAFFGAADFIGSRELHADGDGSQAFYFLWRGIAGLAGDLALQFAIAGRVNFGKWRTGGDESLGIGYAFCGAEDFEELIAFATDAAEEAELLEDQGPGDQRKQEEDTENNASDQACFVENV